MPFDPSPADAPGVLPRITPAKPAARTRSPFFTIIAVLSLVVVLAGFSFTYVLPMVGGTFSGPVIIHLHGGIFFGWILISILQPALVWRGYTHLHRRLGVVAAFFAAAVVIAGVSVAIATAHRDIGLGRADAARAFLLIPLSDMVLFALFVGIAVYHYRKPDTHKRLMMLANVAILPAAFARFFAVVGLQNLFLIIVIMESFVLAGIVYDYRTRGRIHPVYLWGGAALVIVHVGRLFAAGSDAWLAVARWITG